MDGQWVAFVLLADPAVLRNGLAVRHRPQRMDYTQHSTLLHKAVLHSASKKEIGQQNVMSPKFWAAQQQDGAGGRAAHQQPHCCCRI